MLDISWGEGAFPLFLNDKDGPVRLAIAEVDPAQPTRLDFRSTPALVEVLAVGHGRGLNSMRAIRTAIGDRLRYTHHDVVAGQDADQLVVHQTDEQTGLDAVTTVTQGHGQQAYRFETTITNRGSSALQVQQVTSAAFTGVTKQLGSRSDLDLWTAQGEWCAESRWSATNLGGAAGLPDINTPIHGHFARGAIVRVGHSTWSTGELLPIAGLVNRDTGRSLMWQIENSGPWRWEIDNLYDEANDALGLALLGPTDLDHSWLISLEPGESFTTVPVTISLSEQGLTGAAAEMTRYRRTSRRVAANSDRPLIFNDYMNALMGDPTTEKLLPLIDAAATAGAKYFCIDAGWYDDGGNWWPSVGAWEPSTVRFGDEGLTGVLDYIRGKGMLPGLWVEPEVVGVKSKVATSLPDEAFMTRGGTRIVEHDRYFLDFRSQVARDYLDGIFDRLVGEYGARYFKWDYNVTPGTGPDAGATSPGEGLLDHARAHLDWVEALRARYPDVVLEACSSGAMRMDGAILSRYDLQSTSDQQDYRLYAPIAAAAPMTIPFELAGNWAYPQPEWTAEQTAFTLVTGLSGRMYLSGHLNKLDASQLELVHEATELYPSVMAHHADALPAWPLGLPEWDDKQVAVASVAGDEALVYVWNRDVDAVGVELQLPDFAGADAHVECVFPTGLTPWPVQWDSEGGVLNADLAGAGESARVYRIAKA